MRDAGRTLIEHALEGFCSDPDCELHHIEVAIEEEVVEPANVAFWLSGWDAAVDYMRKANDGVVNQAPSEGRRRCRLERRKYNVKV